MRVRRVSVCDHRKITTKMITEESERERERERESVDCRARRGRRGRIYTQCFSLTLAEGRCGHGSVLHVHHGGQIALGLGARGVDGAHGGRGGVGRPGGKAARQA